jgi:CheY-like chemotaxis protein
MNWTSTAWWRDGGRGAGPGQRELRPNGILLDIGLPDVSGLSVLERLKRNPDTRHHPVHVVSATDRSQVARELGAIGFAIKPTTRERLVTAIEQLEQTSQRDVRRLLIVEDDSELRHNLELLLGRDQLQIVAVGTLAGALEQLSTVLRLHGDGPVAARRQRLRPARAHGRQR